jgi:hypothetical protein
MVGAGICYVESKGNEITPKSVGRAIRMLTSSIMKYYMSQNLPNVNESYDKEKNFLRNHFGFDFSDKIKLITSTYDVPTSFDVCLSSLSTSLWLNYWGPMFLFELDGVNYLYQDRGDFEFFFGDDCDTYTDNEIPERLGIAEMGFKFSDIIDIYFDEQM